jgi:uncharacterized cofD-like protein
MAGRVRRVWLEPNNPPAFPEAIQALLSADLIVIGPGSLYTSLLPNLLVPDIQAEARPSQPGAENLYLQCRHPTGRDGSFYSVGIMCAPLKTMLGRTCSTVVVSNNNHVGKPAPGIGVGAVPKFRSGGSK